MATLQFFKSQIKSLPVTTRFPNTRCSLDYEVRICTNKTCSRQGSKQVLQFGKDLALPTVEVTGCGCLGSCGNGPNAAVIPITNSKDSNKSLPILLYHLSTPNDLAEALTAVCGVAIDNVILKCTELRLAGNAAAMNNEFSRAIQLYTEALDLNPAFGRYMLLANRSAARLASGDATAALADATAAVESCPAEFSKAWIRRADALYALGRYKDALEAIQIAAERYPAFGRTQEYRDLEKAIRKTIVK